MEKEKRKKRGLNLKQSNTSFKRETWRLGASVSPSPTTRVSLRSKGTARESNSIGTI